MAGPLKDYGKQSSSIIHLRSGNIAGGARIAAGRISDAIERSSEFTSHVVDVHPTPRNKKSVTGFLRHRVENKLLGWTTSETIFTDYRADKVREYIGRLINLHCPYESGMRLEDIARLSRTNRLVWTMHDTVWLQGITNSLASAEASREGRGPRPLWLSTAGATLLRARTAKALQNTNIVFPSLWLQNEALSAGIMHHANHSVIPNPVPEDFFCYQGSKSAEKNRLGFPSSKPLILFVAWKAWKTGGDQNKGYRLLQRAIEIARRQESFTFAILGHNGQEIPTELGAIWVKPDGSQSQIVRLLRAADIVVGASTQEVLPTTIQEAQAVGTPAIVPGSTGYRDVVVDGTTGLHFSPGKPGDFAENIVDLIRSPQERSRMGREATDRARNLWHPLKVGAPYANLHRKLL